MNHRALGVGVAVLLAAGAAGTALMWRPAIGEQAATPDFDHALVVRGAQLAAIGDCAICHAGAGGQAYAGGRPLRTPFGAVYASNITPDRQTGIGAWSEAAFQRSMHDGVDRGGHFLYPAFPYNHYSHVTDADVGAIYAFLMTREPVHAVTPPVRLPFPLNVRPVMAGWNLLFLDHGPAPADPSKPAEWNRGAYLVEGLGHCAACHTPHNAFGAEDDSHPFAGGPVDGWISPALVASASPAAIPWDAEALYQYLRHGIDNHHAAAAGPMNAVSHDLSQVPEADVRAMAAYIASMTGAAEPELEQGGHERAVAAQVASAHAAPAALQDTPGAAIFAGACSGCHGAGAPMMLDGRPSLALASSVTADTPRNATQVILGGLQPGLGEHGPGERGPWMPGFAGSLTDAQVADVLTYLRARYTDRPAWNVDDSVRRIRQDEPS